MIQVHRQLSIPIRFQFMTSGTGQVTNVLQYVSSAQFIEPPPNQLSSTRPIPSHSKFRIVAFLLQF